MRNLLASRFDAKVAEIAEIEKQMDENNLADGSAEAAKAIRARRRHTVGHYFQRDGRSGHRGR